MGTPANIVLKKDGVYHSIRVHYDGTRCWDILNKHYTNEEKIQKLINLGDLSSLDASPDTVPGHSFLNPVKGYCVSYIRDRKEGLYNLPAKFENLSFFLYFQSVRHVYVWDGEWTYYRGRGRS